MQCFLFKTKFETIPSCSFTNLGINYLFSGVWRRGISEFKSPWLLFSAIISLPSFLAGVEKISGIKRGSQKRSAVCHSSISIALTTDLLQLNLLVWKWLVIPAVLLWLWKAPADKLKPGESDDPLILHILTPAPAFSLLPCWANVLLIAAALKQMN